MAKGSKQRANRRGYISTIKSNGMYDFMSARARPELRMLILNQGEVNTACFRFRRLSRWESNRTIFPADSQKADM